MAGTTTTIKHREFTQEPMGGKPVSAVPGIGDVIGGSMEKAGIKTAKKLYGQYLINPDGFKWKSHGANDKQRSDANNAMKGWDEQHN